MRKKENQILMILSVGTVVSIFFVIRECTYSLAWDTAIMRWLFISQSGERLMSNIAFSYIAAYIFYIVQVYIPKLLNKKNIFSILTPKIEEFIFKVFELSFVLDQVGYRHNNETVVDPNNFPIYYKLTMNNRHYIKKVTEPSTLLEMQKRIEESYASLFNRLVIYNLDVSVLELWEKVPLEYYREIIQMIERNESSQVSIVVRGIEGEDNGVMDRIEKVFGIKRDIQFEKVDQKELKDSYEQWARRSTLPEPDLILPTGECDIKR